MEALSSTYWVFNGLAAVVLAYWGVLGLRRFAEGQRLLDIPNERSSHSRPTPRGGGLAIVAITLLGVLCSRTVFVSSGWVGFGYLWVGGVLVAGISWLDDTRSLPSKVRLAVQSVAAILVLWGVGAWQTIELPPGPAVALGWAAFPVTFLWIVGLTNAYNFMDGIDGLAAGQGVVAGTGWALLGWWWNDPLTALMGLLLACTCLGFLFHNWPPARIFMGDVGSAFLGFNFAALAVACTRYAPEMAIAGILLVWPFVLDTTFTLLRRLRRGENVFTAHRSHLYQRLVISGLSHGQVTVCYLVLASLGLAFAVSGGLHGIGAVVVLVAFAALWGWVVWREKENREGAKNAKSVCCRSDGSVR